MTSSAISMILLALTAAAAMGLMSGYALMRRMTLAGDVMSHIALPGLGLAFLWNIDPTIGAAASLAIGALLIWRVEQSSKLQTETAIGVIFSVALAIGAIVTPSEDLIAALFGSSTAPTPLSLVLQILFAVGVIVFLWLSRDRLVLSVFNEDLTSVTGVNTKRLRLFYLFAFAATLFLGLRFLGALLAGTLVIIPGAIARQFTHTLPVFLLTSTFASVLAVGIGYLIAQNNRLPFGPTVVTVASVAFFVSLLRRKR